MKLLDALDELDQAETDPEAAMIAKDAFRNALTAILSDATTLKTAIKDLDTSDPRIGYFAALLLQNSAIREEYIQQLKRRQMPEELLELFSKRREDTRRKIDKLKLVVPIKDAANDSNY